MVGKDPGLVILQAWGMGRQMRIIAHLDGIPERKVGRKLQVAEAHARDWAGPVSLAQPALYAHPVVGVPCGYHDWVCHQLLYHSTGAVTHSRLSSLESRVLNLAWKEMAPNSTQHSRLAPESPVLGALRQCDEETSRKPSGPTSMQTTSLLR